MGMDSVTPERWRRLPQSDGSLCWDDWEPVGDDEPELPAFADDEEPEFEFDEEAFE